MDNPYSAPASNPRGSESFGAGNDGVTPGVINQLARTKGWVRFMAVLGFIGSAFMLLIGLLAMLGATAFSKAMGKKGMPTSMIVTAGVLYLLMGLIQIYPAIKLNSFASAIGRLIFSGRVSDLVDAIEHQRGFWKFVGVILVLFLILAVTIVVAAIVGAGAIED